MGGLILMAIGGTLGYFYGFPVGEGVQIFAASMFICGAAFIAKP